MNLNTEYYSFVNSFLLRITITLLSILILICYTTLPIYAQTSAEEYFKSGVDVFKEFRTGIGHIGIIEDDPDTDELEISKWLGTGFLIEKNCTFATAKHLFRNKKIDKTKLGIRFNLPTNLDVSRTLPISIIYEHPNKDLAILRIIKINNKPCTISKMHIFDILNDDDQLPETGEDIFIIGFPVLAKENLDLPVIRSGIISSSEINWGKNQMLLLDLHGVPGFSGSPVISTLSNKVIGVIHGPGPTKRGYGFEWATIFNDVDYVHSNDP